MKQTINKKPEYYSFYREDDNYSFIVDENIIKAVEIFRTGVFRDTYFDREYLEKMVSNFYLLKELDVLRNVPVRAGHPGLFDVGNINSVIGYIKDVRLVDTGKKVSVAMPVTGEDGEIIGYRNEMVDDIRLVADFEITEPDALEKIKRTTYRDRSVEMGEFEDNNHNVYYPVLFGVAFVDIPQVDGLAALLANENRCNVLSFSVLSKNLKDGNIKLDKMRSNDMENKEEKKNVIEEEVKKEEAKEDAKEEKMEKDAVEEAQESDVKKDDNEGANDVKDEDKPEKKSGEDKEEVEEKSDDDKKEEKEQEGEKKEGDKKEFSHKGGVSIEEFQKKIKRLEMQNFRLLMKDKLKEVKLFAKAGYSTPAMMKLEKKLVRSFFAPVGSKYHLSAEEQFELYKAIKASTPTVWEKKDVARVEAKSSKEDSDKSPEEWAKEKLKQAGIVKD